MVMMLIMIMLIMMIMTMIHLDDDANQSKIDDTVQFQWCFFPLKTVIVA